MPDVKPLLWLLFCLAVTVAVGEALDVESVSIFSSTTPDGPTDGGCGYGDTTDDWPQGAAASFEAASPSLASLPLDGCGACFQLMCAASAGCGQSSAVNVTMISTGSFSIPRQLFAQLDPNTAGGSVAVSIQQVNCNPPGNLELRVQQYRPSGGGYLKLAVYAASGPSVKAVDLCTNGASQSQWQPMANTYGAVFEASTLPSIPLDVRITNANSQQVIASSAITSSTQSPSVIQTQVQFPTTGALAASPAASLGLGPPPPSAESPSATTTNSDLNPLGFQPFSNLGATIPLPPPQTPALTPPSAPSPSLLSTPSTPSSIGSLSPAAAAGSGPPGSGGCQTVWQILQTHSGLDSWANLIAQNNEQSALQSPNIRLTMWAPVDSAFSPSVQIPTGSDLGSGSLDAVLSGSSSASATARTHVIGFGISPGAQPTSGLSLNQMISTTDAESKAGQATQALTLTVTGTNPIMLKGPINSATVLQADIPACGPSLVNTIDTVLLPE